MEFLVGALKALPSVASSPLSLVGFALVIGAWTYSYNRSRNLKILMAKIALIPEVDRKAIVVATLGDPLPDNISAEQWIISKRHGYYLIAFIVSLIVLMIIITISLYRGTEIIRAQEETRTRISLCESQLRDVTNQWDRSKNDLEQRIAEIDKSVEEWNLEARRGATGLVFAPLEQKSIALDIMNNAQAKILELEEEKQGVQGKLDAVAAAPPVPVRCES